MVELRKRRDDYGKRKGMLSGEFRDLKHPVS